MSTYYNLITGETRDFDDDWFTAATAAGNPKVQNWTLRPAAPSHDSTQHTPEWINGQWVTRDKTAEELATDTRKIWPNAKAFWDEFTPQEKLAILASTDPSIKILNEDLRLWPSEVWSDSPEVQQAFILLLANNLVTETRKAIILTK